MFYRYTQLAEALEVTNPLLMLDSANVDAGNKHACGLKAVSMGEQFFAGHFPGQPIMPGVLQVAAMTQLSRLLYRHSAAIPEGHVIVLKQMRRIKFRKPVLPGDFLRVESSIRELPSPDEILFQVSCTSANGLTCAGQLLLGAVDRQLFDFERGGVSALPQALTAFADGNAASDINHLMTLLPHRPPFLLIDRGYGIGTADSNEVWGYKNITGNDVLLKGSPAGYFPAYLMIEAGAQLGCAHVLSQPDNRGKLGIFLSIDEATFTGHLLPGDQLAIHAECHAIGHAGTAQGEFYVGDRQIASCQLKFIIADNIQK